LEEGIACPIAPKETSFGAHSVNKVDSIGCSVEGLRDFYIGEILCESAAQTETDGDTCASFRNGQVAMDDTFGDSRPDSVHGDPTWFEEVFACTDTFEETSFGELFSHLHRIADDVVDVYIDQDSNLSEETICSDHSSVWLDDWQHGDAYARKLAQVSPDLLHNVAYIEQLFADMALISKMSDSEFCEWQSAKLFEVWN